MSNLLKEKHALAKLRAELEGRKGKLCRCCKKSGHLARNCRNRREGEKGAEIPQNKFKVLKSRVMQCEVEEKTIRRVKVVVKCFKYGEEGHKYRECPQWERKEKRVAHPREGKAHQGERKLARPIREKAQETERRLRRMEEKKVAHPVKGKAQQEEWKRTLVEKLRIQAEVYCGKGVPEEARLLELGWMKKEVVVSYLVCEGCGEQGCHVKDNRGQGVLPWTKHKKLSWCGCKEMGGSAPTERKSAAKEEKAARPKEAKA